MARNPRSAVTERAYLHFAQAPHGVVVPTAAAADAGEDFDESDFWGAFAPAEPPQAGPFLAARKASSPAKQAPALAPNGRPSHGSLPVKIPDWSKILGSEYRPSYRYGGGAGDWWELDDDEDSVDWLPPHELVAVRRRATSLSLSGGVLGRTLKVRDAVWKQTTGFQD